MFSKKVIVSIILAVACWGANAKQYWSDNSISLLKGNNYKFVPKGHLSTMTIEHASGHSWGGVFLFVDRHVGETENSKEFKETYGEVSPKFYLYESSGVVKSLNAAFTYEFGVNSAGIAQDNYLYGVGMDLNIPGLSFSSATYYYANNESQQDDHQITLTYGAESDGISFSGYIDYSTGRDDHLAQFHFNPQLTYNIGQAAGLDNKVELGLEYSYWHNKFGIDADDNDQSVASLLLKAHF